MSNGADILGAGGIGKEADLLVVPTLMLLDTNRLYRGEHRLDNRIGTKKHHIEDHDLEQIQKDMDEINKNMDIVGKKGYSIGFRDLLLIKKSILLLKHFRGVVKKDLKEAEHMIDELLKKVHDSDDAKKHIIEIRDKVLKADKTTADDLKEIAKELEHELQKEQGLTLETSHDADGAVIDARFLIKEKQSTFTEFLRRFQLKYEIRELRRDISHETREEDRAAGHLELMEKKIGERTVPINDSAKMVSGVI